MKTTITGKHLDIGEALKSHIEKSVSEMIAKYFGDALEVHVNLSKGPAHNFETELSFHISRHFIVRAHAEDPDPYRSVDLALTKLDKRTQKYKTRLRESRRQDGALEKELAPALSYILNAETEDNGLDPTPLIIAEMASTVPTVCVSDAVMHMDLLEQQAILFRNVNSGRMNVVFRRQDGNIGWIDPVSEVEG
jgi:ribosomal subunit interface protein